MKGLDLTNSEKLDENFSNTIGGFGSHHITRIEQAVANVKKNIFKEEADKQAAAAALLASQQAAFEAQQAAFLAQQNALATANTGGSTPPSGGGGGVPTTEPEPTKSTVVAGGDKIGGVDSKIVYGSLVLLGAVVGYFAGKQMKKSVIAYAGIGAGIGAGASFVAHKFVLNKPVIATTTTQEPSSSFLGINTYKRPKDPDTKAGKDVYSKKLHRWVAMP